MSNSTTDPIPGSKAQAGMQRLGKIAIVAGLILLYLYGVGPHLIPTGDQAAFLLLKESLAEGKGYRDLARPDRPVHTKFPPGFPALLLATSPFDSTDPFAVRPEKGLVAFTGLLAGFAVWFLLRRVSGVSSFEATLVALLTLLNARYYFLSHSVMSEAPYTLASVALLTAVLAWKSTTRTLSWRLILLLALVFLAVSLRIAAVALLAACALDLLINPPKLSASPPQRLRERSLRVAIFGLASILVLASWVTRNRSVSDQSLDYLPQFFSRGEKALSADGADEQTTSPGGLLDRAGSGLTFYLKETKNLLFLEEELVTQLRGMGNPFSSLASCLPWLFNGILAFGGLAFFYRLFSSRSIETLYVLVTAFMLLLWPWRTFRFLVPILPFSCLYLVLGFRHLGTWIFPRKSPDSFLRRFPIYTLSLGLLTIHGAGLAVLIHSGNGAAYGGQTVFSPVGDEEIYRGDYRDFRDAARAASERIGDHGRILCSKPDLFYYWSRVPSIPFLPTSESAKLLDQIQRHEASHVVIDPLKPNALRKPLRGGDGEEKKVEMGTLTFEEIWRRNRTAIYRVDRTEQ